MYLDVVLKKLNEEFVYFVRQSFHPNPNFDLGEAKFSSKSEFDLFQFDGLIFRSKFLWLEYSNAMFDFLYFHQIVFLDTSAISSSRQSAVVEISSFLLDNNV